MLQVEEANDVYGRLNYMQQADGRHKRKKQKRKGSKYQILETQNVRGFARDTRRMWMESWRRVPVKERPAAWMIQETYVSSLEEAEDLEKQWRRIWGNQNRKNGPQLSYWSVESSKTAGVAILLNPEVAEKTKPWQQQLWTKRNIMVEMEDTLLVNLYAPNTQEQREEMFEQLSSWTWKDNKIILGGILTVCKALLWID
ncbi:hypothetical protein V7S43_015880 [Phytophthora oleae]|uniref:Uncharacterized protein n=1 Tax=Phytophthora oleae TaxID=2107226 RepID=A0ABD3EWT7_9STRA